MQTYGVDYVDIVPGPFNPETVLVIPDSDWVITSSVFDAERDNHNLTVVHSKNLETFEVFPERVEFDRDTAVYGADSPTLTRAGLQSHGMGIKRGDNGVSHLFVVNHSIGGDVGRHGVEAFDVRIVDGRPHLTWRGSVPLPEDRWPTDVAALPGDEQGFLVNSLMDPRQEDGMDRMAHGEPIGSLLEWSPTGGFTEVPGGNLPCPNGVELSADGRYIYVACWAIREVKRIERGVPNPEIKTQHSNGVLVDNYVWTKAGKLLCSGQVTDPVTLLDQFANKSASDLPIGVIEVDPATLEVTTLATGYAPEGWGMASSAAEVGDEIWVGAARSPGVLRLRRQS